MSVISDVTDDDSIESPKTVLTVLKKEELSELLTAWGDSLVELNKRKQMVREQDKIHKLLFSKIQIICKECNINNNRIEINNKSYNYSESSTKRAISVKYLKELLENNDKYANIKNELIDNINNRERVVTNKLTID